MPKSVEANKKSTVTQESVTQKFIHVEGARVHNLKNIDVSIPRNQFVVITGISGSGKSSLAFDTIYAEGQRRYMESFSAYARQFVGGFERPDVDKITGLSPVISIEQKTVSKNPRSTVGTTTEIYDFIRLLFARASTAYSYNTGKEMVKFTEQQIVDNILEEYEGCRVNILAPLVRGRKGHYRELFENIRKQGFLKVRVDGEIIEVTPKMQVDRYKIHDIEVVIDRMTVKESDRIRLLQSIQQAFKTSKNLIMVMDHDTEATKLFSKTLMCVDTGISYEEPSPNTFSFNSPYGACPSCNGLGQIKEVDPKLIIPDHSKSINQQGIAPYGEVRDNYSFKQLRAIAKKFEFSFSTPVKDIPEKAMDIILNGSNGETFKVDMGYKSGRAYDLEYEGLISLLNRSYETTQTDKIRKWAEEFMTKTTCPTCDGARLRKESLWFKIADKNIAEIAEKDILELADWFEGVEDSMSDRQRTIAKDILKEIRERIGFLKEVGLTYLSLNRPTRSLSGGESQRIRLASQIGSKLRGITYILDEPSIGLHQRDNHNLITALKGLADGGNTVLVVEHDKDIMLESDYLIDIGPAAGKHGGKIVGQGTPSEFAQLNTLTAHYLHGDIKIDIPEERRPGNSHQLVLKGASGNNLKDVTIKLPLGKFICVTGVSGSGKSTLINETLYPILNAHIFRGKKKPLPYTKIQGLEHVDKVIEIDQSPIGRTPRSNPATYIGVFTDIRKLFSELPEAKIRGYKPGRFSFNVKGGRCEVCQGGGMKVIEMNFLPDVLVECEGCQGRRFNRETLEVRYKGKSISDVLDMTVSEAVSFFEAVPSIYRKLKTLEDVGLTYLTLGQSSTTISGGEAQRVKLASELQKKDTGQTFYILDEPTTGLHFEDIRQLLKILNRLVDRGNTVLVIEHNLDIVKAADWIIDLGPEGGAAGGQIVAEGTPEQLIKKKNSHTARFLKEELS
ncbi:MAG: excinuclease ABC subunit UvrA [Saprospiraceae bacterium]|nr:excinuclease ABC subunit UvrA [Saprospiraceae bacterium]